MVAVEIDPDSSVHDHEFVAFDVETTGFAESRDHIVEIAAVRFTTTEILRHFQSLVKAPVPIPLELTQHVHGISNEMVQDAPAIEQLLPDFLSFIAGSVLVGHNISFDLRFVNAALTKSGLEIVGNIPLIDTLALSRRVFPKLKEYKLVSLAEYFSFNSPGAHRALHDSESTRKLLARCIEEMSMLGQLAIKEVLIQ